MATALEPHPVSQMTPAYAGWFDGGLHVQELSGWAAARMLLVARGSSLAARCSLLVVRRSSLAAPRSEPAFKVLLPTEGGMQTAIDI